MAGRTCSVNGLDATTYVEVFFMRNWPLESIRTWKGNVKMGFGKVSCENKIKPYLCPGHVGIDSVEQGCTNCRCQVAVASEFCAVAPVCRLSVWTYLHVTLLSPRILRWLLFGKFVLCWC